MNLRHYLRRATQMPPDEVIRRGLGRARSVARARSVRRRDVRRSTYSSSPVGTLARLLPPPDPAVLAPAQAALLGVSRRHLAHEADLLGSGWVALAHGVGRHGLAGHRYEPEAAVVPDPDGAWLRGRVNDANLPRAQEVWRLVDPGYEPVDWSVDLRSGYRWPESTWYLDIRYGHLPGVDVKLPWELARCQHLPQLALAHALTGEDDLVREVRNSILDFVATNPPRYGVNWRTAMDVGIRVVSWLFAYDLLRARGAVFDDAFEQVLGASVRDHALFLVGNLEWDERLRANHYLADICGLAVAAAFLPSTPESDAWLGFAVDQLVLETGLQFGEDGANFEASTSYHRLSSEMVAYATAVVLAIPPERVAAVEVSNADLLRTPVPYDHPPRWEHTHATGGRRTPFPSSHVDRLEGMAVFTEWVTKPSGQVAQIGDNDNGRFLRLLPTLRPESDREDHLDHAHLLGALAGLVTTSEPPPRVAPYERRLVGQLSGGALRRAAARPAPPTSWGSSDAQPPAQEPSAVWELRPPGGDLTAGLRTAAFPDFGLYVWRSDRLFLAVRCGPVGQRGNGGHAHNDQLHVELTVDGQDWIRDPGTGVYTSLPEVRNQYRSAAAHWVPTAGGAEPSPLTGGLFTLRGPEETTCLSFGPKGFVGRLRFGGQLVVRKVQLTARALIVKDAGVAPRPVAVITTAEAAATLGSLPFSPGYGLVDS